MSSLALSPRRESTDTRLRRSRTSRMEVQALVPQQQRLALRDPPASEVDVPTPVVQPVAEPRRPDRFRRVGVVLVNGCAALAGLLLLRGAVPGAVVLGVLLLNPALAAAGLIAVIGERLAARWSGVPDQPGPGPVNALLTGLLVGHLAAPGLGWLVLAVAGGIAAHLATAGLSGFLRPLALPVLSLPFSVVGGGIWLVVQAHPALTAAADLSPGFLAHMPVAFFDGMFRSLSALLFLPHAGVGAVLFVLIAWHSRILAGLALVGWSAAVMTKMALGADPGRAMAALDGYNAMLAAMAVGGMFLVPSGRSLAGAAVAAVIATCAQDAWGAVWGGAGMPAFTVPFAVAVLGLVHAAAGGPLVALRPGATPEATVAEHGAWRLRFPGTLRTLALPVAGQWHVWQGEHGPWTHRGLWRHALDLVITDDRGKTFAGAGTALEDYHAWRKPVLAPVRGKVVVVVDGLPDNLPGTTDRTHNWGNHVVLQDPRGFHVELSHFACGSIRVVPGRWVERGEVLGLCGNSGYSPQPHVHVQVQAGERPGGATLPFSLVSWWDGRRYHANELPAAGSDLEQQPVDPWLERATTLLLDDVLTYRIEKAGEFQGILRLTVAIGDDGSLHLASPRGRLSFGVHEGTFYHYRVDGDDPWLPWFLLALPRLPLGHRPGLVWEDAVPVHLTARSWRAALAPLLPGGAVRRTRHQALRRGLVSTEILAGAGLPALHLAAEFDGGKGPARIATDDLTLIRIDGESHAA